MKYNTGREEINMREYGRHVQQVVEYIVSIEKKCTIEVFGMVII